MSSRVNEFFVEVDGKSGGSIVPGKSNSKLPISYTHVIRGLEKCTWYKVILFAKPKSGCGVAEVYTIYYRTQDSEYIFELINL